MGGTLFFGVQRDGVSLLFCAPGARAEIFCARDTPLVPYRGRVGPGPGGIPQQPVCTPLLHAPCRYCLGEHTLDAVRDALQRHRGGEDGFLHGGIQFLHRPPPDTCISGSGGPDEEPARRESDERDTSRRVFPGCCGGVHVPPACEQQNATTRRFLRDVDDGREGAAAQGDTGA